jgi:N-methylhydantoinase B/oxoprolinase/acetone carboxylase alpha subunit
MPVDPIHFELIRNSLGSMADEMALTIVRTSHSGVLKDNMDFQPPCATPMAACWPRG